MRDRTVSISSLMTGFGAAVVLVAIVFLAGETRADTRSSAPPAAIVELPPVRTSAEPGDELAALRAIDAALSETADGSTYVWGHGNGRLAGAIRVTSTFRDRAARICRHLIVTMRLGSYARRSETIACRGSDRAWILDG
jgi:surface antigen